MLLSDRKMLSETYSKTTEGCGTFWKLGVLLKNKGWHEAGSIPLKGTQFQKANNIYYCKFLAK